MKHTLKLLACGLILFTALGPLVGLLATGIIPMLAYSLAALPAALSGLVLVALRLLLATPLARWQQQWPRWLLLLVAAIPGALVGAALTFSYSQLLQPALYNALFAAYLGAVAGAVCNSLFWLLRLAPPAKGQ